MILVVLINDQQRRILPRVSVTTSGKFVMEPCIKNINMITYVKNVSSYSIVGILPL